MVNNILFDIMLDDITGGAGPLQHGLAEARVGRAEGAALPGAVAVLAGGRK